MKLSDFNLNVEFNNLRSLMEAPLINVFHSSENNSMNYDEILKKLSGDSGIEVKLEDLHFCDNSSFEYHNQKVLLYIRDQRVNNRQQYFYKYHIANCLTIQDFITRKKINRYVVSTRTDNRFTINIIGQNNEVLEESKVVELNICKNCLDALNYKGYKDHNHHFNKRTEIYNNFSLKEYFDQYKATSHTETPDYTDENKPFNMYQKNAVRTHYENVSL